MLSILDRLLSLAEKIIRVISLKNVLIWTIASFFLIVGYAIFESRGDILSYLTERPSAAIATSGFTVTSSVRNRAQRFVDREDLVVGMVILTADIRNNRRIPVFWYSDDAYVSKQLDSTFTGRFGGVPLFTSDDKNNASVVSAINAEFTCSPFDESGMSILFPNLSNRFPVVCKVSVPPFYGKFAGYIIVALQQAPNATEVDLIKAETTDLSNEIFLRN
jgi:hypothetical protein